MRIWAVVVVLLASACSQAAEVDDGCPDVYFVGARGSGQPPGFGPQVDDLYQQFVNAADSDVEQIALDYPAAQGQFGDSSVYSESVTAGASALPPVLASLECQEAAVVVAGYSQGAHVIAISELPAVDAVVLLASPVFAPNDATAKSGSFNPEQGGLIDEVPIDGPLADRTMQVCISGDPICQFGSIAFWVHSGSYFGDALAEAADFAADRLP